MDIALDSIDFRAKLPDLPRSFDVIETDSPDLKSRKRAMDVMASTLKLGKCKTVDLPHGTAYVSSHGEIEFFHASGGIWSRDAVAEKQYDNELRKWSGLIEGGAKQDGQFMLDEKASRQLMAQAQEFLDAAQLRDKAMDHGRVVLDQVAELGEKGETLRSGAGGASVIHGYHMDGMPVFGGGAKTTVAFEPVDGSAKVVGGLHVWRTPRTSHKVAVPGIEEALAVGLLKDPELALYAKKGGKITITELSFGYMALPAMMQQHYLFPVFEVQGRVTTADDKLDHFLFARYHHLVPPASYKKANLYASYLASMN